MKKNKTFIILSIAVATLLTPYFLLLTHTVYAAPTIGDSATKATLGNDIIGGSKYIYNISGVSIGTTTTSTASLVFGANGQIKFADGTTQSTAPGASDVSAAQISPGIFGSVVGKGNYTFQKGANTNPIFMIDATNGRIMIGSSTVSAPRSLLDIATGTVDALVVSDTGNVGIGTTAPGQKLTVIGVGMFGTPDVSETLLGISPNTAGHEGIGVWHDGVKGYIAAVDEAVAWHDIQFNANDFDFQAGGSGTDLYITSAGRVGIGTTTPSRRLDISGDTVPYMAFTPTATNNQWVIGSDNYGFITYDNTNLQYRMAMSKTANAGLSIGTTYYSTAAPANGLIVEGNVGIGTTTPAYKLTVNNGDVNFLGGVFNVGSPTTPILSAEDGGYVGVGILAGNGGAKLSVSGNISAGTYSATAAPANGMIISGSVGIGTSTPAQKLSVVGNIYASGDITADGSISANVNAAQVAPGIFGSTVGKGNYTFQKGANTNPIFMIDATNGRIMIGSSTVSAPRSLLDIATGTVDALVVSDTGNVGIGTTAPGQKLTVIGVGMFGTPDVSETLLGMSPNTAGHEGIGVWHDGVKGYIAAVDEAVAWHDIQFNANDFDFQAGGSGTDLYITSAGRVGIGTTDPDTTLEVRNPTLATDTVNTLLTQRWSRAQTSAVKWGNSMDLLLGSYESGTINSRTRVDFKLAHGATDDPDTTVMTLQSNGNVGIGTTGPGSLLHLYGASGATTEYVKFTSADGGDIRVGKQTGVNNNAIFGTWTNNDVSFYANSAVGMTLQAGGNVGIGTTTPSKRLTVKSSGNGDGINLLHSDDTVVGRLEVETDGDSYMYLNNGSGVNKILLYSNGNSYFTGGNVGIGTTAPQSKLDVEGSAAIGATYSGTTAAPANGLIVEGNVGIGTTTPATTLHVVGTSTFNGNIAGTLSSWINVSFSSGWSNYGGGLQTVQYKKVGDLVFLRGTATSGANLWSSFPVIFVLPSDYRPLAGSLQFPVVMANSAVGVIYITTTGNVAWQAGGVGSGVIYLDGVVFSVN